MKILIGALLAESNAYVKQDCEIQDFTILKGPGIADKLVISELARENDVELIPSLHASCMAAGGCRFRYVRLSAEEVHPGCQGTRT